jgi:hypothetical protein
VNLRGRSSVGRAGALQALGRRFDPCRLHMKKLDLHGIRHADVKRIVIRFLEDNWGSHEYVEVVTGHSRKMQHLVYDVAEEYGLLVRLHPYSAGALRVLME